ncbi:MAG: MarR family winged helix-turn-helix transcriptional regulator [Methanobacterium sp.]
MNEDTRRKISFFLLSSFIRVNKKFNRIDSLAVDMGDGVKLYPSELHVVEAIGNGYANNITSLSVKFGITKGAVSQVVNKLFEKGFVSKERNVDYGKEIIISLTDHGWEAFEIQGKFRKRMLEEFIGYLDGFTPEEIDSFLLIMGKVEDYVDTFLNDELS